MIVMSAIGRSLLTIQLCFWGQFAMAIPNNGGPTEQPPEAFSGNIFVDSRGCVYIRAKIDDALYWVPQLTKKRIAVCDQSPTFAMAATQVLGPNPAMPVPATTLQDFTVSKKKTLAEPAFENPDVTNLQSDPTKKLEAADIPAIAQKTDIVKESDSGKETGIARKLEAPYKTEPVRNMPLGYATAWQKQPAASAEAASRFVQVATFAIKANADRVALRLKKLGLLALVKQTKIKGQLYCVVLSGPYEKKTGLMAALKTTREAGFKDAFPRR